MPDIPLCSNAPEPAVLLEAGDFYSLALSPEASSRDIALAGFLSGFTDELGPVLQHLPDPDAEVLLALGIYHWSQERTDEALATLDRIAPDDAQAARTERLRALLSREVTVLSFSGSPGGGAAPGESAMHALRKDTGPGLRLLTAGFQQADDLRLDISQELADQVRAVPPGRDPDLVLNIMEDCYLPASFDSLPAPKIALLADMHDHILRHSSHYQRHDLLLSLSHEQRDIARRMFDSRVLYMPFADYVFLDMSAAGGSAGKPITFSYGGSLLHFARTKKLRDLWPVVNRSLEEVVLLYQGRMPFESYAKLVAQSRYTASTFDFEDFVTQPRTFEYMRQGAGILQAAGRFMRLILTPLGVEIATLDGFCGREAMASGVAAPTADFGRGGLLHAAGLFQGRSSYAALAAAHGQRPGMAARPGRQALRATIGLCLLQTSRPDMMQEARPLPRRGPWCPSYSVPTDVVERMATTGLEASLACLEQPSDYNLALQLARRLLHHRNDHPGPEDGDSISRDGPDDETPQAPVSGWNRQRVANLRSQLSAEAVGKFPHCSPFVFDFYLSRLGASVPPLPSPDLRRLFLESADRHIAAETAFLRACRPQPLLDLGPVEGDHFIAIQFLASHYLGTYGRDGETEAAIDLSQRLRRQLLAYLHLLKGELLLQEGRHDEVICALWQSLKWSHNHPNVTLPVTRLLRTWQADRLCRYLSLPELVSKILSAMRDAPDLLRAAGLDLAYLCLQAGDRPLARDLCELWFRWVYRVVSVDGATVSPASTRRLQALRPLWPDWVVNRLEGRPGPTIALAEAFIDYGPLETVLRGALRG
ncbi:hypothetical protein ACFOGJ_21895 [Marinibaculum pumilum]|uniref:Tetratricopeptide repeat protein n=1 Tax=Marinibaculum pumilum TaxID=1766165 RepID=A0ABV7L5R9_9PROT